MFNKHLQEQIDALDRTLHFTTQHLEAKIAKLERIIVESGLVLQYEEEDPIHTLYNLNGTLYTINKEKE